MKIRKYVLQILIIWFVFNSCQDINLKSSTSSDLQLKTELQIADSEILKLMEKYIDYWKAHPQKRKVYQIFITGNDDTTILLIKTALYRSEFGKRMPTQYTRIHDKLVFLYTGLDKLIRPDSTLFKQAGFIITSALINDVSGTGAINYDSLVDYTFFGLRIKKIKKMIVVDTLLEEEMTYGKLKEVKLDYRK